MMHCILVMYEYILVYARDKSDMETASTSMNEKQMKYYTNQIMTQEDLGILRHIHVIKARNRDRVYIIQSPTHTQVKKFGRKRRPFGRIQKSNVKNT